jgi:hypothetical protein
MKLSGVRRTYYHSLNLEHMNKIAIALAILSAVLAMGTALSMLTPIQTASAVSAAAAASGVEGDQAIAVSRSDPLLETDTTAAAAGPNVDCETQVLTRAACR